MNFFKYIEARFVGSQLAISKKQVATATSGIAVNKSFRAWMWLSLQVMTLLHILLLPLHYLGVIIRLIPQPKSAAELMEAEEEKLRARDELAKKVSADLIKGGLEQANAVGGMDALDSISRKGSA